MLGFATASSAAITTIGSPLGGPATLDTGVNLRYAGTNTPLPSGTVHTSHWGADTALWNTALGGGVARVPAAGQALKVRLEGCARAASRGPAPLSQIHFQDVSPLSGGGAKVNLTSQPFEIPICDRHGASASTVSTYRPINLCVSRGDYVAFNDEGGFVPNVYGAGVRYEVMGAAPGSTLDSFIRSNGTGNGAVMSSSDVSAMDGFASNQGEELMLQVTLATGQDASSPCRREARAGRR